jgi:hypothetical protein
MAPYSMDLRTRVLRDSDAGVPSKEVAAKYASAGRGSIGSSSGGASAARLRHARYR